MKERKIGDGSKGRKYDWETPVESRISVPYELAQREQKKALVEIWAGLREAGLDLTDLAEIMNQNGINFIQQSGRQSRQKLCRKYSTAVAASFGVISTAEADDGGYEEVNLLSELIREPDRTILLEVVGNSMRDDGIYPGSLLIVETRDAHNKSWIEPNDRDHVIALVNGSDLTVKLFRRIGYDSYLVPRNRKDPNYQPILIRDTDEEDSDRVTVEILGIVKSVIQKL